MCDIFISNCTKCYEIQIDQEGLSSLLVELIDRHKNAMNIPFEAVFTGLLTTVGSILAQSDVEVNSNYTQALSLYSLIVGLPSTNKSRTIELFKNHIEKMEQFLEIKFPHQRITDELAGIDTIITSDVENNSDYKPLLNNSATVESLLEVMSKNKNLYQVWDEFTNLIGSFGIYKPGGGAYDRAFFLSLYNGPKRIEHQTKKYTLNIENPRLSIFSAAHPHKISKMISEEIKMEESCDGFMSRFLICFPKPMRLTLVNTEPFSEDNNDIIQLWHLFSLIKIQHKNKISYVVEKSGNERFDVDKKTAYSALSDVHEYYDKVCTTNELIHPYISFIYGKAKNQLIRICGILKILESSIELIKNNSELLKMTKLEFEAEVDKHNLDKSISLTDIKKAEKINNYFLKIKLTISNFEQSTEGFSFIHSTNKLGGNKVKKSKDSIADVKLSILNARGREISLTQLSLNREANKNTFKKAAEELDREGFGKFIHKKKSLTSKNYAMLFQKTDPGVEDGIDLANKLINYGISILDYTESYKIAYADDESSSS